MFVYVFIIYLKKNTKYTVVIPNILHVFWFHRRRWWNKIYYYSPGRIYDSDDQWIQVHCSECFEGVSDAIDSVSHWRSSTHLSVYLLNKPTDTE